MRLDAPLPNKRKIIRNVALSLLIAVLLAVGAYAFIINPWISNNVKPVIISGKVLCADNEPVEGIWVDTFDGNTVDKGISGYADLRPPDSNQPEVEFAYVLKGDAYNLHVGCGGSKQHWKGIYITEAGTGPVHDHNYHFFICHDMAPDYGSCDLKY